MEMDFANACPLVRPVLPRIRFLFVELRLCSTLPSDGPSRFRPCASLVLHLHQVTQGTFTPKLSDMSDTHAGLRPPPPAAYGVDSACHPAADCHQEVDGKVRPIRLQMSCRKISLRQLCADPDRRSQRVRELANRAARDGMHGLYEAFIGAPTERHTAAGHNVWIEIDIKRD